MACTIRVAAEHARFGQPAKQAVNSAQLTALLDEVLGSQPMAHWREAFDKAHLTYGIVRAPSEVVKDPHLTDNDIVVPLEDDGGKLTTTISSPIQIHCGFRSSGCGAT